jgi:hypothetical protein
LFNSFPSTKNFSAYRELREGIAVTDENGKYIGKSQTAAKQAITQVILSRIGMAVPGMSTHSFIP